MLLLGEVINNNSGTICVFPIDKTSGHQLSLFVFILIQMSRSFICFINNDKRHGNIRINGLTKICFTVNYCFVTKWIKSCLMQCFGTFKMPILMFISILVFRPEGQIWNPVRRDTRIYVRRVLNASRISKTQLNSCTISPS